MDDILNWSLLNVENISSLFYGSNITDSQANVFLRKQMPNLRNASSIFSNCSELRDIDLSNLNFPNLEKFYYTFNNSKNLNSVNLANFNTPKVNSIFDMFNNCCSLTSANLSN
jgi:surface protein